MSELSAKEREKMRQMTGSELSDHQLRRLNQLLARVLPRNDFYAEKLADVELPLESLDDLQRLPFTFKSELVGGNAATDYPANLTYDPDEYVRFHRTSGTRGRPMVVLDTAEDWQWWTETWQYVLDAAGVSSADRAVMAFSFGPFIGFWSANDAVAARGAMVIPSGGMSSLARLDLIRSIHATCIFCTPSYALHLAETGADNQVDVGALDVQRIIVAGEPGGSVPAIRDRIESAWNASVFDHAGASEIGPWGYADAKRDGMHVIESEFIAEFLSVESGEPAEEGRLSELVLTSLGRSGSPVLRYRTGDLVRPRWRHDGPDRFVLLEGGVLGRADDMLVIRGVNIYPSSIEQILRSFPEIIEYRMRATRHGEMDALSVEVEDRLEDPTRVARELQLRLGLKVQVTCVPIGSLPRFEAKGKRFVDER